MDSNNSAERLANSNLAFVTVTDNFRLAKFPGRNFFWLFFWEGGGASGLSMWASDFFFHLQAHCLVLKNVSVENCRI